MRPMKNLRWLALATVTCLGLVACASTATYNPTVFPFEINEERLAEANI